MNQLRSTEVSPKTAAIAIVVLVAVLASGIGIYVSRSQNIAPAASGQESVGAEAKPSVSVDVKETVSKISDRSYQDSEAKASPAWKTISDRNIFKPIPGYSTSASSVSGTAGRSGGQGVQPMPLGVLPGFANSGMGFRGMGRRSGGTIAYTGLVETPQGQMALLENTSTLETKYVAVGDEAFGMQVVDISPRTVTMDSGMSTVRLAIGENKSNAQQAAQPQGQQTGQAANSQNGQQAAATATNGSQSSDASGQSGSGSSRRSSRRSFGGEMGGPPGGGMGMPPGQ